MLVIDIEGLAPLFWVLWREALGFYVSGDASGAFYYG